MDFTFLHDPLSHLSVIMAPRRQSRPNIAKSTEPEICPFCIGQEGKEEELYRIGDPWAIRVLPNKYPFAPHHEIIIHSPDHHKNIDELPIEYVQLLLQAYKARFLAHQDKGKVFIFHNHGIEGGESLPHPHTQLVVIPRELETQIPVLSPIPQLRHETDKFVIFCPDVLQWPDEVWIASKKNGEGSMTLSGVEGFGSISDEEIADLALVLQRLIQLMDMRHGHEFPFNFYISPEKEWYIRIIPRLKRLGGFELGTNIFVNTQDPKETIMFIKEHFDNPDVERIQRENRAEYVTGV